MKSVKVILFILVGFAMSSCSVKYVHYTISTPPRIDVSQSALTILLVNRFDPNRLEFKKDKKTRIFKEASLEMLKHVEEEFRSYPNLRVIAAYDSVTMANDIRTIIDSSVLSTEQIRRLTERYHADYILSLEQYSAGFNQDNVERVKNADGSTSKTAYYSVYANSTWAWYNIASNTFDELKGNASQPHSDRAVVSGLLAFGPAIVSNEREIKQVTSVAVRNMLVNYRGEERQATREVYSGKALKGPANDIISGNYETARSSLQVLAKAEDDDLASKALYNLAVLSEIQGNAEAADDFAKLSLARKNNLLAKMFLGFRSPILDIISQAR